MVDKRRKDLRDLQDESGTNFAELYFVPQKLGLGIMISKSLSPNKEEIEKLLKMASDPDDKKDLLKLVQDYKIEVIKS